MANVRGCNLPDDLYYLVEKHVWAKPMGGGLIRVGITAVAAKLSGGKLAAILAENQGCDRLVSCLQLCNDLSRLQLPDYDFPTATAGCQPAAIRTVRQTKQWVGCGEGELVGEVTAREDYDSPCGGSSHLAAIRAPGQLAGITAAVRCQQG